MRGGPARRIRRRTLRRIRNPLFAPSFPTASAPGKGEADASAPRRRRIARGFSGVDLHELLPPRRGARILRLAAFASSSSFENVRDRCPPVATPASPFAPRGDAHRSRAFHRVRGVVSSHHRAATRTAGPPSPAAARLPPAFTAAASGNWSVGCVKRISGSSNGYASLPSRRTSSFAGYCSRPVARSRAPRTEIMPWVRWACASRGVFLARATTRVRLRARSAESPSPLPRRRPRTRLRERLPPPRAPPLGSARARRRGRPARATGRHPTRRPASATGAKPAARALGDARRGGIHLVLHAVVRRLLLPGRRAASLALRPRLLVERLRELALVQVQDEPIQRAVRSATFLLVERLPPVAFGSDRGFRLAQRPTDGVRVEALLLRRTICAPRPRGRRRRALRRCGTPPCLPPPTFASNPETSWLERSRSTTSAPPRPLRPPRPRPLSCPPGRRRRRARRSHRRALFVPPLPWQPAFAQPCRLGPSGGRHRRFDGRPRCSAQRLNIAAASRRHAPLRGRVWRLCATDLKLTVCLEQLEIRDSTRTRLRLSATSESVSSFRPKSAANEQRRRQRRTRASATSRTGLLGPRAISLRATSTFFVRTPAPRQLGSGPVRVPTSRECLTESRNTPNLAWTRWTRRRRCCWGIC